MLHIPTVMKILEGRGFTIKRDEQGRGMELMKGAFKIFVSFHGLDKEKVSSLSFLFYVRGQGKYELCGEISKSMKIPDLDGFMQQVSVKE